MIEHLENAPEALAELRGLLPEFRVEMFLLSESPDHEMLAVRVTKDGAYVTSLLTLSFVADSLAFSGAAASIARTLRENHRTWLSEHPEGPTLDSRENVRA